MVLDRRPRVRDQSLRHYARLVERHVAVFHRGGGKTAEKPQRNPPQLPLFLHLGSTERGKSHGTIRSWSMSYNTSGSWLVEFSAHCHSRPSVHSGTVVVNNNRTPTTGHKGERKEESARKRAITTRSGGNSPLPAAKRESDQRPGDDIPPSPNPPCRRGFFSQSRLARADAASATAVYAARLGAARTASSFHAARTVCPTATAALRTAFAQGE